MDTENSPSSSSSYDFLLELTGPLKQVAFECFASNRDPVQFIGKFNSLLNEGLVSVAENPETIIQSLIEMGCAKNDCHPLLMSYLDALWECKYFNYKQYVNTLISYRNLDKPQCMLSFSFKIAHLLKRVDCDFRDDRSVYEICDIFVLVLRWYSDLLFDIFTNRRENAVTLAKTIGNQLESFANDPFSRYVVFCASFVDSAVFQRLHQQVSEACDQMHEMSKNTYIPKETKELIDQLPAIIKSLTTKPDFPVDYVESYRFGSTQPRPTILSLVTVYSVFRVLSTNEEVADAIMNIGEIMLMNKVQILIDLFRGTFLILLDYHEADETEQHRDLHTLVLTEVFAYKRLGPIVELLLETGQCTTDQLIEALSKVASNSVLLNALDRRQLDNTLSSILNNSRVPQFLGNEYYKKIMELRMHSMKKDADLFYLLYGNKNIDRTQQGSRYWHFVKADGMARQIQESPNEVDHLIVELIDQADLSHIDLVLACLCAGEKIKAFSSKLSTFITNLEHNSGSEDSVLRNQIFDSSFLLLMRIRQLFSDLRLEEMTDGNTNSTFYKWTEKLYDYLEQNQPLPVNEEIKQSTFIAHFSRLKLGHAFWNNSWDFSKLLDHTPAIGEALLDEISTENKMDEETLKNILKTFGEVSSMFLCLCQWLETNPSSEGLQTLATNLQNVGVKFIETFDLGDVNNKPHLKHELKRWVLTMQIVGPILSRLARGPRSADIVYPYLVNCARRLIRPLDPMEIPAMQVLKNAFFYGTQQGWASPNVIVCIDRMIKNVKQVEWTKCWFQQMFTKLTNADELEVASELCLAAAMTKPPICFLCIIQKIIDEKESINNMNNHTWIMARMLLRAMLIVCWSDDKWKDKRKSFKRWQMSRKRKAEEDLGDELLKESETHQHEESGDDDTVIKTLKTVFLFFQKEVKPSIIRLRTTFICFFMLELAMTPKNEYRQRLIQMIPDGMIFTLCRLEPTCFNLPVLLKIYDMENPEHRQLCLQLACMLRKIHST